MTSTIRRQTCLLLLSLAAVLVGSTFSATAQTKTYDLDDPSEPWRGSKSGISTRVMPPYTPLVRHDDRVKCWGRSYGLGGLLPTSVTSQNQEILAQPIALMLKTNGSWTAVDASATVFTKVSPDRIDFSSAAEAGPVKITTKSWIEYDGLIRTDLTLECEQTVVLQGMRVVFPFAAGASIFHHTEMRWNPLIYRRSPSAPDATVVYSWQPLVWVGNHDVGFTVVTETSDGWTPAKDAIRLRRRADELELSLEIITQPIELSLRRRYSFGLMATPAKPMREDRWSIRIGTLPGGNLTTAMSGGYLQPLFSFPQPGDFEKTAQMLARKHRQGMRFCYYITTSATSAESKVNRRNHTDWVMSKVVLEGDEWKVGSGVVGADACCPASSFADFLAWGVEQAMDNLDFDGIYIDNPGPYWCQNTRHGCGAGGKRTYPFFALRDLHKRIYTIVKTKKPDGIIWEHTSQTFNPLQLAWVDIYSDGEHFRNVKAFPRAKLLNLFDRTYMEITGTGHQVGAVPSYLSSMGVRTDGDWSHWLLSRVLPWGQMVWAAHGWLDSSPAMAASRARFDFGLDKEPVVLFRPHELPKWFALKPESVVACLWQRERDKALLALLANWDDQPVRARINERRIAGRLGPVDFKDAMTGIVIPERYMMISIPGNSFRMITIEPKSKK